MQFMEFEEVIWVCMCIYIYLKVVVRKTFILNPRKEILFLPWSMDPKKREQDPEFLGQPHSFMSPHFIHRDGAKYSVSS